MSQVRGPAASPLHEGASSPSVACRVLKGHEDSVVGLDLFCSTFSLRNSHCRWPRRRQYLSSEDEGEAAEYRCGFEGNVSSCRRRASCEKRTDAPFDAAPGPGALKAVDTPSAGSGSPPSPSSVSTPHSTPACPCDAGQFSEALPLTQESLWPPSAEFEGDVPWSFMPWSSSLLASASDDGTVRLWDMREEKAVACIRHPLFLSAGASEDSTSNLGAVKFHPESCRLLYVACSSQLLLFDLSATPFCGARAESPKGLLHASTLDTEKPQGTAAPGHGTQADQRSVAGGGSSASSQEPTERGDNGDKGGVCVFNEAAAIWSMEHYAQLVTDDRRKRLSGKDRKQSVEDVECSEDDDDPLTINDFDLWCPSPQQLRDLKFAASLPGGESLGSPSKPASRRTPTKKKRGVGRSVTTEEASGNAECSALPGYSPVCLALPLDSGEVVVALHRTPLTSVEVAGASAAPVDTVGSQGALGAALQLQRDRLLCMHRSICGVARFRKDSQVPDLVTGGFDFNVNSWNLVEAKPRTSLEVRRAVADLRHHVMPWEEKSSQAKASKGANSGTQGQSIQARNDRQGDTKCLNPPFVVSLAMSPECRRVAVGLGDGHLAVFDYANSSRNARLFPAPSWSSQPHSLSSAALYWASSPSAVHSAAASTAPHGSLGRVSACSALPSSSTRDIGSVLVSCGTDRRLCVFTDSPVTEEALEPRNSRDSSLRLLLQHRLPYKPNCMVCASSCAVAGCSCQLHVPSLSRSAARSGKSGRCCSGTACSGTLCGNANPAALRCYVGDVSKDIRVFEFPC
uniref:WD domain, G-beta repeat-containing protein n=1 Tax=Toxoplasma gondii COUG TaxID=1074873 RepID=A0A2G8Y803_TOXGO|nr:WD domain, G-beta repeat-containing protein [Toxoplasma gondii COUG]